VAAGPTLKLVSNIKIRSAGSAGIIVRNYALFVRSVKFPCSSAPSDMFECGDWEVAHLWFERGSRV